MIVDLKLNPLHTEVMSTHVEEARAAGCTLFRMHYDDTLPMPVHNVRLEWPTEPGSEARSVWRRSGKADFWQLQSDLCDHIALMTL